MQASILHASMHVKLSLAGRSKARLPCGPWQKRQRKRTDCRITQQDSPAAAVRRGLRRSHPKSDVRLRVRLRLHAGAEKRSKKRACFAPSVLFWETAAGVRDQRYLFTEPQNRLTKQVESPPFEGWAVRGRPWMSLLCGQVLLTPDGTVEQKPGFGRYLACSGPRAPVAGAAH